MKTITNHGMALARRLAGVSGSVRDWLRAIHIAVTGTRISRPKVRMNFVSPAIATASGAPNCCA